MFILNSITSSPTRRSLGVALALAACGCQMNNPAFGDPVSTSAGTDATDAGGTTQGPASDAGSAGTSDGDPTNSGSATDGATTSTTGVSTAGATTDDPTTGPGCVDVDLDGVTDCEGDCNDDDPNTSPELDEICGDAVDNNCDELSDPEDLCMGLGTFVSQHTGDDITGTGTKDNPVQTITQGLLNASAIGNGVDVYVAEGTYSEPIAMIEGTDLLGGYQCDGNLCSWARDPEQFISGIQAVDADGVVAGPSITSETRIDGFKLVGKSGNPGNNNYYAAMSVLGGTPVISSNLIEGGNLEGCSGCRTVGLRIQGASNQNPGVRVVDNELRAGTSPAGSHALELRDHNDMPTAQVLRNTMYGGKGHWSRTVAGLGAAMGTVFRSNHIYAGEQFADGSSSFAMYLSGYPTVDSNYINDEPGLTGTCPFQTGFLCGGIELEGFTGTISNNVIYGLAAYTSAALHVADGELPYGDLVLVNNVLHGGGGGQNLAGISAAIMCRTGSGQNATIGIVRNNILLGGDGLESFGFYERTQNNGATCQPSDYENNDIFDAEFLHRRWLSNGPEVLLSAIADVNNLPYAVANISANPGLDASYHVAGDSPCVDAGTMLSAPANDFEGDARPLGAGVDIGADETE